jgi:hypothetical protein
MVEASERGAVERVTPSRVRWDRRRALNFLGITSGTSSSLVDETERRSRVGKSSFKAVRNLSKPWDGA